MYQENPLLESTVARRLVDSGKITDPKTIRMMIRKGWIPTKKKTVRGLRRAATNMAKKHNYRVVTKGNGVIDSFTAFHSSKKMPKSVMKARLAAQGPVAAKLKVGDMFIPHDPSRYRYHSPIPDIPDALNITPMQSAVISWHEGREAARNASKVGQQYSDFVNKTLARSVSPRKLTKKMSALTPEQQMQFMDKMAYAGNAMGGHYPGVMRDEFKLANMLKRRYGTDISSNVSMGVSRNPVETQLGKMTAKQDMKARIKAYKDALSVLN